MSHSQTQRNIRRGRRPAPRFNAKNPEGLALCDGCSFLVNHVDLKKQMEYRGGAAPVWTGTMVCDRCLNVPQPYFQRQVLRPDPIPLVNPRPDIQAGAITDTYASYASGSLPSARTYYPGSQITVTGGSLPGRAYADNNNWRNVETGEVVT